MTFQDILRLADVHLIVLIKLFLPRQIYVEQSQMFMQISRNMMNSRMNIKSSYSANLDTSISL